MTVGTQFVKQAQQEARTTANLPWAFGQGMVRSDLEERVADGLRAFAQLWFMELTDEKDLPDPFYRLVDLCDQHYIADLGEFEDDDEDDDDDPEE